MYGRRDGLRTVFNGGTSVVVADVVDRVLQLSNSRIFQNNFYWRHPRKAVFGPPALKTTCMKTITFWIELKYSKAAIKKVAQHTNIFQKGSRKDHHRIREVASLIPPRQSSGRGRCRGGRANQKVAQRCRGG